ncbi:hypothetical protein [Acetobacter okinawensis]|uniref:hypothetical protein n=1 Tax=Acetobacter okinawensis TaxID=1076594 RepID=UPI001177CABC|nr:hypothetical protein [Acetobacter okinawensis]
MSMKQMTLSPLRLALFACVLTGLCACAEDPDAHYYRPHRHMGQAAPDWYRPPATPAGSTARNNAQRQPDSNPQALQYDR